MTETMLRADSLPEEVFTDDALAYARTIHRGLAPRERRALAAVLDNMPCTVSTVAGVAGISRRTAQRACEALAGQATALLQRTEEGLIIAPDAIAGVEAWAGEHGPRSGVAGWWENPEPTPELEVTGYPQGQGHEPWPDDVFPVAPSAGEDIELALRAVESRHVPPGRGTFIPFAVLDYVTATPSLQTAKVALECGRRASRAGVAEFHRGELARVTRLSSQQVSNTLALLLRDGIATEATTARVELDLTRR